jgi:hypothetical protein
LGTRRIEYRELVKAQAKGLLYKPGKCPGVDVDQAFSPAPFR